MKRGRILFFLSVIFFIGFISACSDNQRIMRLYIDTNSHGAVWNDNHGYNIEVCYDEIFGKNYNGANPHDCNPSRSNTVLYLYQNYNSHANAPESGGSYNIPICFGDLECRSVLGSCDVSRGEQVILNLAKTSNSHISKISSPNYPIKICCKSFLVDNLYWTNIIGEGIDNANLNDRVKLVATGLKFEGKTIEYQIKKREGGAWVNWFFPDKFITAQTSSSGFTTWVANRTGEYYFTIKINGEEHSSLNYPRGILTVSSIETNSPPIANIDIPDTGYIFLRGNPINFQQSSYDTDDYINYLWSFGDMNSIGGSTRDYLNYNTVHTYSSQGQKSINLSVIDERGLRDFDIASILIIDPSVNSIYVFANISKPGFGEILSSSNPIDFDASGSFALQVRASPLPLTYTCLGGDCPLTINGVNVDRGSGARGNYNPLNFTWKFDDGISITKKADKLYRRGFSLPGVHFANLTVSYTSGEKNSAITVFTITPGLNPCQNGNTEFWIGSTRYSTLLTNDKCKGIDPIITLDDCCPAGYLCRINDSDIADPKRAVCQPDSNNIQYCQDKSSCGDYDQLHCVNPDICGLGASGGGSESCGAAPLMDICGDGSFGLRQAANCRCEWNFDSGRCEQKGSIDISISGISIEGTCITDITNAGECLDGELSITQESRMDWDQADLGDLQLYLNTIMDSRTPEQWLLDNCQSNLCFSGTRQLICGENTIKLVFFTWMNLISVVVLITIIYIVWFSFRRMKNNKQKKRKKKK